MSIKSEITKSLIGSATRVGTKLAREMVQLPSLNFRYNLVDKADKMLINGVYKALSAPANLINESKEIAYEARKNKSLDDVNFNNNNSYNLNQMLQQSVVQSHAPLYSNSSNINPYIAEQMASLELASRNRRNIYNNFKK
ncbi:TPA: hypothetical protein ACG3JX_003841 [Clostridioides difficile]